MVPDDFQRAYEGLVDMVERISGGEVREEVLREEVDTWRRVECRGAAALTKATTLTLRYELASSRLAEGSEAVAVEFGILSRVEEILEPPESRVEGRRAEIVEVAMPEELLRRAPNGRGFRMGRLQIIFEPSQGPPHGHLSVSHPERYPTFEELLRASHAPGGPPPNLWAWVPKPEEARSMNPNTVHLYVLPPEELLG